MADDVCTPADLARELDVSPKRVRDVLRAQYGLLAERGATRWMLSNEQAEHVRRTIASRR